MKFCPRFLALAAFSVTAVFLVSSASAQRFGFSRTNSLPTLAGYEAVQKELGITGDLAARLGALGDEYRNASQKEFTALGIDYSAISDLPALERAAEMRKATDKTASVSRQLAAEFTPKVQGLLTPDQFLRLKQIQLQASGVDLWTEPEVAKELDLSAAQQAEITALRNEYSRRQQLLDGDFQQRFAKIRELNAERDNKAHSLLTPPQREILATLKGPAFDTTQLGFGRRRGNN